MSITLTLTQSAPISSPDPAQAPGLEPVGLTDLSGAATATEALDLSLIHI